MTLPGRLVLLGHPVSHSLSPRLQQAALRSASIALEYEAVDVAPAAFDETVRVLIAVRAAGNVTIPHKESMYAVCHSRSPIAERVGAVNTFWVENGRVHGDNTDVGGFDSAIRAAFGAPKPDMRLAVLGAGGAAAAVLAAAERWAGASAVIASRSRERAAALAGRFTRMARVAATYDTAARDADLVVNATPLGLKGEPGPVDPAILRPGTIVYDLVYRRGLTPWVIRARARGLAAEDGLGMLVEQGALAFTRWFGIEPDRRAMWDAVSS